MPRAVLGNSGKLFKIVRELGRGGFGVVYLARDDAGHQYAVKTMGPVVDPSTEETFVREVEAARSVSHENVLKIGDFGSVEESNGDRYLFTVAEYCAEGDCRSYLVRHSKGSLDVVAVVDDFRQVLYGLQALHKRLVHRDIKPENILIRDKVLKIGDFGLSKFIDQATKTLTFKGSGTPRYMAPEVWELARATPATDLYSVGVMLFETLAGKPPFEAGDLHSLRDLHLYRPAARVKSLNPAVPDKLDGIVRKLLSKEPRARYQTAEEVVQALHDLGTATTASGEITAIAARVRQHHDAVESQRLEAERARDVQRRELEKNQYMERELVSLVDAVVEEVNAELPEVKIHSAKMGSDRTYRLGNRMLVVHFFRPGELYHSPEVPGRMETLRKRHAIHGGYLEIKENNSDREGWNVVLVRPPDSMYGEWILC